MSGSFFLWIVCVEMEKCNEADRRKIYHTLYEISAKGSKTTMGKIKEIFSDIKEEIRSSAEERATYSKVEKAVEETRMAENEDYARKKHMRRVYKVQIIFGTVMYILYIMAGGLAGIYITHCIYKYDVFGIDSFFRNAGPNHGTGKMALLQLIIMHLIINMLPFCFSLKLFETAREPLRLMIWWVKSKIYAPIFIKRLTKEKMDRMHIKNFLCFLNTYMMPTFTCFYVDARGRKHEIVYRLSDEQADELERKCKEIFPKPESNVSDYIAFALNKYRKVQKN